jgi:hypothetical protein
MSRNIATIGKYGMFAAAGSAVWTGNGRPGSLGATLKLAGGITFHDVSGMIFDYRIVDGATFFRRIVRNGTGRVNGPFTVTVTTSPDNEGLARRIGPSESPLVLRGRIFVPMDRAKAGSAGGALELPAGKRRGTIVLKGLTAN